jgi:hypothetical protein
VRSAFSSTLQSADKRFRSKGERHLWMRGLRELHNVDEQQLHLDRFRRLPPIGAKIRLPRVVSVLHGAGGTPRGRAMNILLETSAPCAATLVLMMRRLNQAAPRLVKAHRIIFNAIRDRDAEAAETWMRRHMVDSRRGYELAHLDMENTVDLLTP